MQTGELVAGRELDAMVAEKIMGWQRVHSPGGGCRRDDTCPDWHFETMPAYSSDISAAWQVMEHFRERGWQILVDWDGPRFGAWVCELWEGEGKPESLGANAPTAPLAICLAALAALNDGI